MLLSRSFFQTLDQAINLMNTSCDDKFVGALVVIHFELIFANVTVFIFLYGPHFYVYVLWYIAFLILSSLEYFLWCHAIGHLNIFFVINDSYLASRSDSFIISFSDNSLILLFPLFVLLLFHFSFFCPFFSLFPYFFFQVLAIILKQFISVLSDFQMFLLFIQLVFIVLDPLIKFFS